MGLGEAMDAVDEMREREERFVTLQAMYKDKIDAELYYATERFGSFHSAHEGFAVLQEEVDELWDEVKFQRPSNEKVARMRHEAIQVAAMALRFLIDVCGEK